MRSIGPKPFNAKRLGEDLPGLELTDSETPLNVVVLQ
jgi:3-oxosteroid 1-dehydrogenase